MGDFENTSKVSGHLWGTLVNKWGTLGAFGFPPFREAEWGTPTPPHARTEWRLVYSGTSASRPHPMMYELPAAREPLSNMPKPDVNKLA